MNIDNIVLILILTLKKQSNYFIKFIINYE